MRAQKRFCFLFSNFTLMRERGSVKTGVLHAQHVLRVRRVCFLESVSFSLTCPDLEIRGEQSSWRTCFQNRSKSRLDMFDRYREQCTDRRGLGTSLNLKIRSFHFENEKLFLVWHRGSSPAAPEMSEGETSFRPVPASLPSGNPAALLARCPLGHGLERCKSWNPKLQKLGKKVEKT